MKVVDHDAINAVPKYGDFADLEGGQTLQLTVKEQTFPGGKYNAVTRIDFLPRKYQYDDGLLDSAPCLDDFILEMSYAELKKLITQGDSEPEYADSPPFKRPGGRSAAVEDNGDEDDDEEDLAPAKRPAAKKPAIPDDDDNEDDDEDSEEEDALDEDEDEEPEPPKKKVRR